MITFHQVNREKILFENPLFNLAVWPFESNHTPFWVVEQEGDYQTVEPYLPPEEVEEVAIRVVSKDQLWAEVAKKRLAFGLLSPFELFELYFQASAKGQTPQKAELTSLASPLKIDPNWFFEGDRAAIFKGRAHLESFSEPNKLAFKDLKQLALLTQEELTLLGQIFSNFTLKTKQLRASLEMLNDTRVASQKSLVDLLNELPTENYEAFRLHLLALRYPKLTQLTQDLAQAKKQLPQGVKLILDETFEEDEFTLQLSSAKVSDLIPRLQALLDLAKSEKLNPLYQLI